MKCTLCDGLISDGFCEDCGAAETAQAAAPSTNSNVSAFNTAASSLRSLSPSIMKARKTRLPSTTSSSSKRSGLGAGFISIPAQPQTDPLSLIRADLQVPAAQRICTNPKCPGEGKAGEAHKAVSFAENFVGFCRKCRTKYSFKPLAQGTMLGQYKILGPLAVGGCGFVYMGEDTQVGSKVIIKGLINDNDADAAQDAIREKTFLANLRHPTMVSIVNFYTDEAGKSYIIMEYVDGVTLKSLRKNAPLAVAEAIAYILAVLQGISYLHSRKVLYCDMKPDNAMLTGDRLVIIDLGGARMIGDAESNLYFTVGYAPPESETFEPSPYWDIYTVARTLAVLILNFDFQRQFKYSLPRVQDTPVFQKYYSLYRFLVRCTQGTAEDRFSSADEAYVQLLGVLREVISIDSKQPGAPLVSDLFAADFYNSTEVNVVPQLKIDQSDNGKASAENALSLPNAGDRVDYLRFQASQLTDSLEIKLRLIQAFIDVEDLQSAQANLDAVLNEHPFDWRMVWMKGVLLLAQNQPAEAYKHFDAVYTEVPGEGAPKVALAIASELKGDLPTAIMFYELVFAVDPTWVSAGMGLARCLLKSDRHADAVATYDRIPLGSAAKTDASLRTVEVLLSEPSTQGDFKLRVERASSILNAVPPDNLSAARARANAFKRLVEIALSPQASVNTANIKFLGINFAETDLKHGAYEALMTCKKFVANDQEKWQVVKEADAIRPRSLF